MTSNALLTVEKAALKSGVLGGGSCFEVMKRTVTVPYDWEDATPYIMLIGSFIGVNDQIGNLDIISTQLMSSL